ncbi:DUF748 domain-containing protein [Ekhidna sp.]
MKVRKKVRKVALGIIILLIILHVSLPFILVRYVNNTLNEIPDYKGSVEWIHVNLFRGAYQVHSLELLVESEDSYEPFFKTKTIDLSIEWRALLRGRIVGELIFTQPELVFIALSSDSAESNKESSSNQNEKNVDWTKPLKDLMPLAINRFEIISGSIHYKDLNSDPEVDIFLDQLNGLATNLSNAETSSKELPSELKLSGKSIGNGQLEIDGYLNVLLPTPNFDFNLSFEEVDMTSLNDFTKAYTNIDFERGTLNVYGEFAGQDGQFDGYIKPLIKDLKLVDFKKDKKKPFKLIWESIVGTLAEIFENQGEDQFATKVPLKGSYENINSKTWPAVRGVLKNAFIEAFKTKHDDSINLKKKDEKD